MILQAMGEKTQALACYERAVQLQPDFQDALLNYGVLLRETWQHHKALECFERLLVLAPNHHSALANCATLLDQMSMPERSIPMFERLVQLAPDHPYGLGMLAYDRLRSCDWRDVDQLNARILDGVRAKRQTCRPFALMAMPSTARDHFLAARVFAQQRFPKAPIALWNGERYTHERLRVGYVSPDFREHPVSHLMTGIFERHDRTRFETYAISIGNNDGSRFRTRLEGSFDHFLDLAALSPRLIAERVRALEIDVLVDLAGFTSDGRPDIFSWRPAPVQVGFLGYPGTMGTDYMDFIVADRHVVPPEHQPFFAERVAYMPDTYLPTDVNLQVAERTPTRAECGLPEAGPVLCAFSHNFKIHPHLFDSWMRLLRAVPDATLWLMGRKGPMQANLQREAAARGVDPARLVFAGRVPAVGDHLARYRLASLFLDTWPYNAHTTAADALLAGLPVVTLQGEAFPARVAASLLHAIGLPDLVTQTLPDYEALVLRLLGSPAELAALKARLQANRSTQPLFDSERFCRNLEGLFLQMHAATPQLQSPHGAASSTPASTAANTPAAHQAVGVLAA
jgi:predicted O-linked N-acetylglucosamine transferase (SPINDLY family)